MGAGFVLLMILAAMLLVAAAASVVAGIITVLVSKRPRSRKVLAAISTPFVFILSLFFSALAASILVSEITGADMGIGDTWYLPINDQYTIVMIDTTESGYIESQSSNTTVVSIQQTPDKVYGLTAEDRYFSIDLKTGKLVNYDLEKDFFETERLENDDVALEPLGHFYERRSNELVGYWMIVARVGAVALSILIAFVFCRMIVFGRTLGLEINR